MCEWHLTNYREAKPNKKNKKLKDRKNPGNLYKQIYMYVLCTLTDIPTDQVSQIQVANCMGNLHKNLSQIGAQLNTNIKIMNV